MTTLPPRLSVPKIYFDTNFLLYLCGTEYDGVKLAFNTLKDCAFFEGRALFVELIASQYVLFEFFENRKKLHYKDFLRANGITIEIADGDEVFSKYQKFNYFQVEGHNYIDIFPEIQQLVEDDLTTLSNFDIRHEAHVLNEKLFIPTKHFCLTSRVSRHDCLITASAIYPNSDLINFEIFIWTNDSDYIRGYYECTEISNIFSGCQINIEYIRSLENTTGQQNNLLNPATFGEIRPFVMQKVKDYLTHVNAENFIGLTEIAPRVKNVIYIQNNNANLSKPKLSLTVIGKDLDFIVNSNCIFEFWSNGTVVLDYPINTNDVISCIWSFPDSFTSEHSGILTDIVDELKKPGHLVFINDYYED